MQHKHPNCVCDLQCELLMSNRYAILAKKIRAKVFVTTIHRGGSRMRGAPGTLVFASHLHPHPEVRICATNIFTGSDIVAATIFRFVNGRCHHYTSSTCVRNLISHDAFENLGPRRVPAFSCCWQ